MFEQLKTRAGAITLMVVALVACGPAYDLKEPNALDASWLQGSSSVSAEHLAPMFQLARPDPEATAILQEATKRLGGGTVEGLAATMSVCGPEVRYGGVTVIEGQWAYAGRAFLDIVEAKEPSLSPTLTAALAKPARERRRHDWPDMVEFEATVMPRICFARSLSVGAAYEAVVHELVHALRTQPADIARLVRTATNEGEYLRGMMTRSGGEIEAYRVGVRARLKVAGGHDRPEILTRMSPQALETTDAATLADLILAPAPQGLGYAGGIYRGSYASWHAQIRGGIEDMRAIFAQLLEDRRQNVAIGDKNVEVMKGNLVIHAQNLGLARQRGDRALEAASVAGLAKEQAELERWTRFAALARTSEARIVAAIAEADAALAAFPP